MNFIIRGAKTEDVNKIYNLASQFNLLNLQPDKKSIENKIEVSEASFSRELEKSQRKYLFVIEDLESESVAGSSQITTKHGTIEHPRYSFSILKKERFSQELGVGFIHQILRLKTNTDGPTEIGGLVVDKNYRRRPEKIGKLISLCRFNYIGMFLEEFEKELHSEMAPPLTDEGRSEFWEALGRRFTGMPYKEADAISHQNNQFIPSLFPEEDIYLCLLDSRARLVLGQVGPETQGALHMLKSIGFQSKNEVDPFDGGPYLGAPTSEVSLIRDGKKCTLKLKDSVKFDGGALVGVQRDSNYMCGHSAYYLDGNDIYLPGKTRKAMNLSEGEEVYLSIMTPARS